MTSSTKIQSFNMFFISISFFLSAFLTTRLAIFDIQISFLLFSIITILFTLLIYLCIRKKHLKIHSKLIFIIFFIIGTIFDRTSTFCDISRYIYSPIIYIFCNIGSGLILGYIADKLLYTSKFFRLYPSKDFFVFTLIINLFAIYYITCSKTVYYWDNAGYWSMAKELSETAFTIDTIKQILSTILFSDYNTLIAVPIAFVMKIFGASRLVFVLSIVNLYLLPSYFLLFNMIKSRYLLMLMSFTLIFLVVTGFIDIASLFFATLAIYITTINNLPTYLRYFSVGVVTIFTFILRRYYMLYSLAFLIIYFLVEFTLSPNRRKYLPVLVISPIFSAFYFMQPFIYQNVFQRNIVGEYTAYQLGINTDYFLFVRYFGLAWLLLILLAIFYAFIKKEKLSLLCGGTFLLSFFMFTRVQTHGQQHLLMYLPLFFILITDFVSKFNKKWLTFSLYFLAFISTLYTFIPKEQPSNITEIKNYSLLPTFSLLPVVRSDINDLVVLHKYIDTLSNENHIATVTLLASSLTLNRDVMLNLYWSLNLPDPDYATDWIIIPEVDSRDTNPSTIFYSDYIVVATPLQLHLDPSEQTVLLEPYLILTNNQHQDYVKQDINFTVGEILIEIYKNKYLY